MNEMNALLTQLESITNIPLNESDEFGVSKSFEVIQKALFGSAVSKYIIDDKTYEMQSPVMNGTNPVKDNSMSQQRVWNSMCRSFVKCVAIHTGLGFNLWLKEEMQPFGNTIPKKEESASAAQIQMIKKIGEKV